MRRLSMMIAAVFLSVFPAIGYAQQSAAIRFPAGASSTQISGRISGRDEMLYTIGAEAGQTLSIRMNSANTAAYFNVFAPGSGPGDQALAIGSMTDPLNEWSGRLSASGTYTIQVYLYRNAARRGESAEFDLDVSVKGRRPARVEGDFADGLAGGPDFLQVSVVGDDTLNLRARPSAGAKILTRLVDGQNVRNMGCRMSEGGRWCHVETIDSRFKGWASGAYLIEGSAPENKSQAPLHSRGPERVHFAAGTSGATLHGALAPGDSRRYALNIRNGQDLVVEVRHRGNPISYQIFNPDQSFLLDQVSSDLPYRGQVWQTGDHVIEVINRTNGTVNYTVVFGVD